MPSASWANGWLPGDTLTAAEVKKGVGAIYDSTLGSAGANFDITGIVATYAHLRIMVYARGDTAATTTALYLRFNNDSAANYQWQRQWASGATPGADEGLALTFINCGNMPAASAGANEMGAATIDVPFYAGATNQKNAETVNGYRIGGSTGQGTTLRSSGWWSSGAAVNRVTIYLAAGNLVAGSRCTVYAMGA